MPKKIKLPCQFQIGDKATAELVTSGATMILPCCITGVHFYPAKVKYDIEVIIGDSSATRLYNIDSVFIIARK